MSRSRCNALAIAAFAACGPPSPAGESEQAASVVPPGQGAPAVVQADGLTATLQLSPTRVAPGGQFTVRVGLTNTTREPARLVLACPALAMLSVRTERGDAVDGSADLPSGCVGVIANLTLAAGRDTVVEMRGRAVALTYPPLAQPNLARGNYVVVASPTPIEVNGRAVRLPELTRRLVVE